MTREQLLTELDTDIWDGPATDREIPAGFDVEKIREIVWKWSQWFRHEVGALVVDETGWFWYLSIRESPSIAWADHVVRVTGPVDARRAFGSLFVPLADRHKAEDEWERAKAKWSEE